MASDGLNKRAKKGKCRICYRVRDTNNHLKIVGEVRHGFATGHIWECIDIEECDSVADKKIVTGNKISELIKLEKDRGRYAEYRYFN